MAGYKVIQDIEAEDHLLGPLSMRQFIYAAIVAISGFIAFKLAFVAWWLIIPMLPHMVLFAILAAPLGQDQPSEIWLLAKIRFALKPRRRIWDQSGIKELVTVTAPKKVERHLTNNLTQTEVRSRLQALANTIDSRGWVVKNVSVNAFSQPSYLTTQGSDRLIDPTAMGQQVPLYNVTFEEDMLDERNNPTAQMLDKMMTVSAQQHRELALAQMKQASAPTATKPAEPAADYWFMNENSGQTAAAARPGYANFDHNPIVAPGAAPAIVPVAAAGLGVPPVSAADEQALLEKIHEEKERPDVMHSRLKVIEPLSVQQAHARATEAARRKAEQEAQAAAMKAAPDPVIIELASRNDLNVDTLGRVADREISGSDGEVVINLH